MTNYLSLKLAADETSSSDSSRVRCILVGSPDDVMRTIRILHVQGFAEVKHWSALQPIPNSNEVISVLIKRGICVRE
jgi:hypothetical protein